MAQALSSAFHALPLPPPTFWSPPLQRVDRSELTEEVFDTLSISLPAYLVSSATVQVAMTPITASQVNMALAALQVALPPVSASAIEAASAAVTFVTSAAEQVATSLPIQLVRPISSSQQEPGRNQINTHLPHSTSMGDNMGLVLMGDNMYLVVVGRNMTLLQSAIPILWKFHYNVIPRG